MRRLIPTAIAMSASAALALALPTSATAANNVIDVDQSINGIKIGNKERVVRNKLGTPKRVINGSNAFGRFTILKYGNRFTVTINELRGAVQILTSSTTTRTADGIGVNSTRAQLRAAYPVSCMKVPSERKAQVCETRTPAAGETSTVFRLKFGVVRSVELVTLVD